MNKMYSEYAHQYAKVIKGSLYNAHFERPNMMRFLPEDLKGARILDLGCGPGEYFQVLKKKGAVVTALDKSEEMVEMTREFATKEDAVFVHDLHHKLALPDMSFDHVIAPLVIHYVKDIFPLFAEVSRVLKSGGLFIFSTHHPYVDFVDQRAMNYYAVERLNQKWKTVGEPVEVIFYRRPLSDFFGAMKKNKMSLVDFHEGRMTEQEKKIIKDLSEEQFDKLTTAPCFIFFCMQKI